MVVKWGKNHSVVYTYTGYRSMGQQAFKKKNTVVEVPGGEWHIYKARSSSIMEKCLRRWGRRQAMGYAEPG